MNKTTNRGSEWKKWDLHVHTPFTYGSTNRYGTTTIEEFCNKIIENDISVIALTNYFYITENEYNAITKLLKNKCLVIPNFEFRASDKNNKGDHINFHILFDPKIKLDDILNSLKRVKLHNHTDKYCCEKDITELGIESVSIDFETLLIQLKNDFDVINDFIVISPYTGYGGFKNDNKPRNTATEKKFDEHSHAIYGNISCKDYFLNERKYKVSNIQYQITNKKAVLRCSDAHCIDDLNKNYTWIKSLPTFEGLKQIIYEPEQRVKIQKEEPDFKEDKLLIDEIVFSAQDDKFTPVPIKFNKNLNVIIGGKSSGKSILLYNIAKTLLTDRSILKYKNPDNGKLEYKYEFENSFNFEVTIKSGNKQFISRGDNEASILSDIKYIPQNYLSELAERKNKKGNELNKLVRDLILEDDAYLQKYNVFLSNVRLNDSKRESYINNFFYLKEKITTLTQALNAKGSKEVLNSGITANEKKVYELKQSIGLTEEQIVEYNASNTKLELINLKISKFQSDFLKTVEFNNEAKNIISQLVAKKGLFINSIETEEIKQFLTERYNSVNNLQNELNDIDNLLQFNENRAFINMSTLSDLLSTLFTLKTELENKLKPFVQNNEIKKQIEIIEKSISEDKQKISEINQLKTEIRTNATALSNEKNKIFELYRENYSEYQKIIQDFELRVSSLEDDQLQINGYPKFNFPKFRLEIESISDLRSLRSVESLDYIYDQNKNSLSDYDIDLIISDLKGTFESFENNSYPLVKNIYAKEASKKLLNDYFFDYWEVESDNDTLDKMSTGKASFVILKLIISLSKSKAPILIDQPEDNLDNRSISKDLVEYLKSKKLDRQIILVTHNANVVVNADAENIIVANQKGQNDNETTSPYQFDYINGPMENSFQKIEEETDLLKSMGIREHIADIVEGGKEAFKKREEKYGF